MLRVTYAQTDMQPHTAGGIGGVNVSSQQPELPGADSSCCVCLAEAKKASLSPSFLVSFSVFKVYIHGVCLFLVPLLDFLICHYPLLTQQSIMFPTNTEAQHVLGCFYFTSLKVSKVKSVSSPTQLFTSLPSTYSFYTLLFFHTLINWLSCSAASPQTVFSVLQSTYYSQS